MLLASALLALLLEAATPVPEGAAAVRAPESRTFVGEVVTVDVPNRRVVLVQGVKAHGRNGNAPRETVTVHVPFTTRVVRGTKAASLTDVKPHDHAVVRYTVTPKGPQALSLQVAALEAPAPAPGS